jgi:hypothetical protein
MLKRWLESIKTHKMPQGSLFYDTIIPGLFILLGVVTVILIVYALGILVGVVPWS